MASSFRVAQALALVVGLGGLAWGQAPKTAPQAKAVPKARAAAPQAKTAAAPNPVLATVNGEPIRASEFRQLLNQFSVPAGREQPFYEQAVDYLVSRKLLGQFLREQRVEIPAKEVEDELAKYRQEATQRGTSLETMLSESNVTPDEFRERLAQQMQFKKYVLTRGTEAELRKYADANKDLFNGTEIRASHILFALEPDADDTAKQRARTQAEAVRKQIDAGQISFADAANKFSEDPGNKATPNGGDLDYFPRRGKFIEPFAAAAFGMKKGEVSEPVETEYGIHLIQVTDRREGRPYDFERDKQEILTEYASDLQRQIVEEQRKKAKIDVQPMPPGLVPAEAPKAATPKSAVPKAAAPKAAPAAPPTPKAATPKS